MVADLLLDKFDEDNSALHEPKEDVEWDVMVEVPTSGTWIS